MSAPAATVAAPVRTEMGWPRALWLIGSALAVVMVVHVALLLITGGPISGPVSLRKPATFAETGWLLCWATAMIMPRLRTRPWQRHVVGGAVVLFAVGETTIIGIQAWRGVPSHYNFTTPLDTALVRGGAAGTAGVLIVALIVLLVTTLRSRPTSASVRLGVVGGIVVLLAGCGIGLTMIFNNSGVFQGSLGRDYGVTGRYLGPDAATVGPDYAGLRPATAGGDLVLPHAIGVHGLLLVAVPAVVLSLTALSARARLTTAATMAAGVVLVLAVLLAHALAALPLDALDPLSLAGLAVGVLAYLGGLAVTALASLRARPRRASTAR